MLHILALNVNNSYYLKLINCNTISKDFDIDEESKSKSKSCENSCTDNSVDEFLNGLNTLNKHKTLANFSENVAKSNFQYLMSTFPNVHYEIQIPPPRA
ncbi:MAG: hypothetical protein V4683_14285 [Bacteroidota bacterium]